MRSKVGWAITTIVFMPLPVGNLHTLIERTQKQDFHNYQYAFIEITRYILEIF